jgi:hypothetical protein
MIDLSPNASSEMLTGIAFIAEAAAYFMFYNMGRNMNARRPGRWNIGPRMLACIATAVVAGWLMRWSHGQISVTEVYTAMSGKEQGEYLGRIWRSIYIPALMIIGVSATRAWRDKQERNARARQQQNP